MVCKRQVIIEFESLKINWKEVELQCSGIPIFRTLDFSNLLIIRSKFLFPWQNIAEICADFSNYRVFKLFSVPLGGRFNVSKSGFLV